MNPGAGYGGTGNSGTGRVFQPPVTTFNKNDGTYKRTVQPVNPKMVVPPQAIPNQMQRRANFRQKGA